MLPRLERPRTIKLTRFSLVVLNEALKKMVLHLKRRTNQEECCKTRVKKILEQVSRTRFLKGFEFRALSFSATQQGRRGAKFEFR